MSNTWHTHAANVMNPQLRKGHQGDTVHFGRGQLEKKNCQKIQWVQSISSCTKFRLTGQSLPSQPWNVSLEYAVKWSGFMWLFQHISIEFYMHKTMVVSCVLLARILFTWNALSSSHLFISFETKRSCGRPTQASPGEEALAGEAGQVWAAHQTNHDRTWARGRKSHICVAT